MRLHTASEVISLARRLEKDSADFYERLAKTGMDSEPWRAYVKENGQNIKNVERAYYSVISDAIEGGFAFDIEEIDYTIRLPESTGLPDAMKVALETEGLISKFYASAALQSHSLLADVPRVFRQIAQKRRERIEKLEMMLRGLS